MLLSIIVPVYNVEKYLERCVDSLLDQGVFEDYEIILVNDGSTDRSPEICESYKAVSEKVRVLYKENGGLSSARNAGIREAEGDYVMFVDSDDYIKSECLGELIKKAVEKDAEIVCFDFSYIHDGYGVENNTIRTDFKDTILTGEEYLIQNLKNNTMIMTVWKNLYKKNLIINNGILFREGYVHEDEEWTPRIFCTAKRVCQYHEIIYGYYIRSGSISNSAKSRKASIDLLENCKSLKEYCKDIKNSELKKLLENNIVTLVLSAYFKGQLKDYSNDVISIVNSLYTKERNTQKVRLVMLSPQWYLLINSGLKRITKIKSSLIGLKLFLKKCVEYSKQKLHKVNREIFVCRRQRKLLNNHSFSIISSTCNGGVITSELREKFRTPTVNVWFKPDEYVKMISNLKYYMSLDVVEVKNSFYPYPVGKIDDVHIYFMHYHSFEEARNKWNERKERINYDNLFFMMAERNECSKETIRMFDELPYQNKIIFTKGNYPEFKSAIWVKECAEDEEVAIMTDRVKVAGRIYDSYLDYVKWLNGEKYDF